MRINHTRIDQVDRPTCDKIQVTIVHRFVREGDVASPARMRGQATWAATRLYEEGKLNGAIPVKDVRTIHNTTQVTFGF